jgi:hypothetical protein
MDQIDLERTEIAGNQELPKYDSLSEARKDGLDCQIQIDIGGPIAIR